MAVSSASSREASGDEAGAAVVADMAGFPIGALSGRNATAAFRTSFILSAHPAPATGRGPDSVPSLHPGL